MTKLKTMLLWLPKGCRKAKVQGTATAECSAIRVDTFRRMAREGKGTFWIVDGATAADARAIIAAYRSGTRPPAAMHVETDDGRTVAIGTQAVLSLGWEEASMSAKPAEGDA